MDNTDAKSITHKGYLKEKEGQEEEAISFYLKALSVDPNYALARFNLGQIYKKKGRIEEALKEWKEALQRGAKESLAISIRGSIKDAEEKIKYEKEAEEVIVEDKLEAIKKYIDELKKDNANWRAINPKILRLGDAALPALCDSLNSNNDTLRKNAAYLLAEIGNKDAVKPLKNALKTKDESYYFHVKHALEKLGEDVDQLDINKKRKWWKFWS